MTVITYEDLLAINREVAALPPDKREAVLAEMRPLIVKMVTDLADWMANAKPWAGTMTDPLDYRCGETLTTIFELPAPPTPWLGWRR